MLFTSKYRVLYNYKVRAITYDKSRSFGLDFPYHLFSVCIEKYMLYDIIKRKSCICEIYDHRKKPNKSLQKQKSKELFGT